MTPTSSTPNTVPPSPNDQLASEVANALEAAGLIKDSNKEELLGKLKSGGVSQDDWNLWIDLATVPQVVAEEVDDE